MQKQQLRNNKIKGRRTRNIPMFILTGLIAMIVIIAIIYYVFLRYSPEQIITYSGYAIEGKTMAENLKSSEISNIEQYLNLVEVKENDLLYKRLNSYYIGEDDKKEIDINYPMYINDGNTVWNLSNNTKLITVNYEEVEGYPEFMLTGGVMYNSNDLTRADGNQYIFLKSEDEIYTNVDKIKVKTATNEYELKEYSNIYFTETSITYYEMQDGYMEYKRISDIDNNSEIEVNGETLTYKTFLEKLGVVQSEENNANNSNEEENIINENTIENEDVEQENNNPNNVINNETENEWQEGMWAKPEVSCSDFEAEVYTIRTNLTVTDRAGVITRGVIFEISLDGRLNRRVQATQTGELEITGLQPDTSYEIVGIVYYNDENGVEQEEEFYTGTVTTKSIDTLGTIDFSFQNGEIYSNKIELIHLKINNDINEEVIKGISRLQLEIDGIEYRLSNDQVTQIKAGEEITYQTSETIDSNSKIRYEITAFDKFGNELKEINNTGETVTSKQAPSVSIRATKQDVTEVNLEVSLTNKDDVTLENYRYEIVNQSGDTVKEGILTKDTETLIFTDLDPNGYYQIIIYGDYDLENGDGKQINQELGRGSFVTRPIASLGYMQVRIDDKEVTQNSMDLGISIDSNQTDARLIAILDKVEVVIYDQGKNINNGNDEDIDEQTDNEIKRITLTDDEVEQLKTADEVELNLDQLTSNTKYRIDVITTVKQGTVEEVVEDKQNLSEIVTLKMLAEVQIRNQFVIGDMIDLDIRVEDIDNAVLTQEVRIEVRDEENKLVNLSEMSTNSEYERKTYENLEPNTTYRIIIYAPQYNEGSTDETYEADYILKEIEILTEAGISGKLDLLSLEKTPSGKNLIDVSSKVNWYERCFNTYYAYGLNYDETTKILTLGGTSGNNRLNYYDLSKYIGQEVTISFKAKTSGDTSLQIIEKTYDDFNDSNRNTYYTINDLSSDWKEYSYTVTLNRTGYIGFVVGTDNAKVEIQDLQIELGSTKTTYEEFKYTYNANVNISLYDARDEIVTNDYYIRIYKDDKQIQEIRYEEVGENNKIENVEKAFGLDSDSTYKIELLVKVQERYYELDSQKFTTEDEREIKGISNENDFLKIQPYGEYIILNDLNFSGVSSRMYLFGSSNLEFNGTVNFNGKTITENIKEEEYQYLFDTIGEEGLIENIVINLKLDNDSPLRLIRAISARNNGTIQNIILNIVDANEVLNDRYNLFCFYNYGIISNFIVNFEESIFLDGSGEVGSVLVEGNHGTIKNGYVKGENIKMTNGSNINGAVIAKSNSSGGIVKNVFSLISIDLINTSETNHGFVNLVYANSDSATIQNVYSVGIGENMDLAYGPNIHNKGSTRIFNNYYFSDEIFTSELETKGNKLSLWDTEFQNQLINEEKAFIVDDLVNEGYYPHLDMPDVMPVQEYIELPEVEDADLPDILSTKILEQGTNTVKVEFSVNNPSSETISNIEIENLEVEILSQEYSNGKSTVIAELKNPMICVSSYDVLSISTRGSFNSSYTRKYVEGERVINVNLYKEIWNVQDWKNIGNSVEENYILMDDLNFINEGNSISILNFYGILDGNGHTISNINLTRNASLVSNLYGTIENLYINNLVQEAFSYGGLISTAQNGSKIDNVHLSNVEITKLASGFAGGIVRFGTGFSLLNSSVNNLVIKIEAENTLDQLYLGGLSGYVSNTIMENCYSYGVEIYDEKSVNSGVGGISGNCGGSNRMINCYAEGRIVSDNANVGGLIGYASTIYLDNCYSKVNISTTNNYVGGLVGSYNGTDISTINNNLSIGNLYTTSGIDSLNRVVGSNSNSEGNNYAYKGQLLQGYIINEPKGATLLDKEQVLSLNLGTDYNYADKEDAILPKLYNTEGTELLPNQKDIYLESSTESGLELENIEATKPNTTEAEIAITIKNPDEIEITGITIEDMESTITRKVTQNGITSITVRATPTRFYDSYKLTEVRYKAENSTEERVKKVESEIEVQFYKEIYTYEDWQAIEEGTYQNYRLMADIDFSGRDNVKSNITVNRLEAENNVYTLKNITLEFNEANTGLINNVKMSMKNIGFENISLTNTANSGNYFGLISSSNGEIENLNFKNINIDAKKISYVGLIGMMNGKNLENVNLNMVNINGSAYIGGLAGRADYNISGVEANDINITATGNFVGGIIGYSYISGSEYMDKKFINIINSNISSEGSRVGGIIGNSTGSRCRVTDSYVNNANISGHNYVGGMTGEKNVSSEYNCYNNTVENCYIYGSGEYIGGLNGRSSCYEYYALIKNCGIYGTSVDSDYVGGIIGGHGYSIYSCKIIDSEVISKGDTIGGVAGLSEAFGHGPRYCYVENTTVEGSSKVGGMTGEIRTGDLLYGSVNAKVIATSHTAGGLVGYMDNSNTSASVNVIRIWDNSVNDTTVISPTKARRNNRRHSQGYR